MTVNGTASMSIYNDLGLEPAINSSGKMTALGGSVLGREVTDAMAAAGREHVVIADLMVQAGRWIAGVVGTEDACVSSGASSGVAISVASVIAGTDKSLIQGLPGRVGRPFEIVIQKGHAVDFGAPITQMIALGGGQAVDCLELSDLLRGFESLGQQMDQRSIDVVDAGTERLQLFECRSLVRVERLVEETHASTLPIGRSPIIPTRAPRAQVAVMRASGNPYLPSSAHA